MQNETIQTHNPEFAVEDEQVEQQEDEEELLSSSPKSSHSSSQESYQLQYQPPTIPPYQRKVIERFRGAIFKLSGEWHYKNLSEQDLYLLDCFSQDKQEQRLQLESKQNLEKVPDQEITQQQFKKQESQPLKELKWLEQFSDDCIHKITLMLEEIKCGPGEFILKQNELDDSSLYILQDGMVDVMFGELVLCTLSAASEQFHQKQVGCTFGEFGFFTTQQRTCSVVSNGYSKLLKLKHADFLKALTKQSDFEMFHQIRQQIELNDFSTCHLTCYSCRGSHLIKNCPNHHLVLDKEAIIKRSQFSIEQNRCGYMTRNHTEGTNTLKCLAVIQKHVQKYLLSINESENQSADLIQSHHSQFQQQQSPQLSFEQGYDDSNTIQQQEFHQQFDYVDDMDKVSNHVLHNQFNINEVLQQFNLQNQGNSNYPLRSVYSPYTFDAKAIKIINFFKMHEIKI